MERVPKRELQRLRERAASHDAYLYACRVMAEGQYAHLEANRTADDRYHAGWLACLREFSQAVVDSPAAVTVETSRIMPPVRYGRPGQY